jgi:hypothetical protein
MATTFLPLSQARRLSLVVLYPGTGYGHQRYVIDRLRGLLERRAGKPILLVIPETATTAWEAVKGDIDAYAAAHNLRLVPAALMGWSGGAWGVGKALKAGAAFPRILLADPSPSESALLHPGVRMWYQPANWRGSLAHLGVKQARLAPSMGGRATLVDADHNKIFDMVAEKGIVVVPPSRRRRSQRAPAVPVPAKIGLGIAASLLLGLTLWLRLRRSR